MGSQKKVSMIQIFETSGVKSFLFKFLVLDNGSKGQKLRKKKKNNWKKVKEERIFLLKKKKLFSREKPDPLIFINHYDLN